MDEVANWAASELYGLRSRCDWRLLTRGRQMLVRAVSAPSGLVSEVFEDASELQAAYDFLRNGRLPSQDLLDSIAAATASRLEDESFTHVVIDGTSMVLTDRAKAKPLGPIGAKKFPTRGLKVVDAVAVGPDGVLQGVLDLQIWARGRRKRSASKSRYKTRQRRATEMRHWSRCVEAAGSALEANAPGVRPWYVMDREADEAGLLRQLVRADARFTIRAAQNRRVIHRGQPTKLFEALRAEKPLLTREIELSRTPKRKARSARVELRATRVTVLLPKYVGHDERTPLELNVVEVLEPSRRKDRVRWVLLTTSPVETLQDVEGVIQSYTRRWRVEEFHRAWKSGGCGVESIQLRSGEAIRKWSIMLATVAARTERLRQLARTTPDAPATIELSEDEIAALIIKKRRIKTRVEEVPDGIPTIRTAVRWIGDLGGYSGHYKGYEPGTKTLSRGLEKLAIWTEAYLLFGKPQKKKREKR